MHIGQHIKEVHIHRIFRKENMDIALLERISKALNYDFFRDLSNEFQEKV